MRYIALVLAVLLLCGFDFKVRFPDKDKGRLEQTLVKRLGYQETLANEQGEEYANPMTKLVYLRKVILRYVYNEILAYEANRDAEVIRQQKIQEVQNDLAYALNYDGGS